MDFNLNEAKEVLKIDEIKNYLRIDNNLDDDLLINLVIAAHAYLINAGVMKAEGPLYDLAVKLLVAHWYENREVVGKADKLAFSLEAIITQLKYCGDEE